MRPAGELDAIPEERRRYCLEIRAAVLAALRAFFAARRYLEVETPVRVPIPALELHIDAIPADTYYLRTSPEFHLKRLLADGLERIVEIGPCFRRGERGDRHNPEYTMVEWYRVGATYRDIMQEGHELLCEVFSRVLNRTRVVYQGRALDVALPWSWLTISDVFMTHAGWDPVRQFDADRFDSDMLARVEPALPTDRGAILADYPVAAAALARCRAGDPPVAERCELYLGGMELANAYSELTDPAEQRQRLLDCRASRAAMGREPYAVDEAFLSALDRGLPACAGIALGLDRLVMLMTDSPRISDVRAFTP